MGNLFTKRKRKKTLARKGKTIVWREKSSRWQGKKRERGGDRKWEFTAVARGKNGGKTRLFQQLSLRERKRGAAHREKGKKTGAATGGELRNKTSEEIPRRQGGRATMPAHEKNARGPPAQAGNLGKNKPGERKG